jgi:eukaryotic-like serine/threonine-protein kinase
VSAAATSVPTLAEGYEPIAPLRRGRTLEVWDAWSHERGCRCVLKTVREQAAGDRDLGERLLAEGRLLSRLTHLHLVRAWEVLEDPRPTVVLETLGGQTVSHLIEHAPEPLRASDVAQLGLQVGSALGYLHRRGILHLDLKPSNVIAEAGRAKLIDLSVARAPGPAEPGIGTWCYLSPEQARGGVLDAAADVWGLGALLYEAAGAVPPFDDPQAGWTSAGPDETSGVYEGEYPQLSGRARPISELRKLPAALASLIDRCLEPEAAARPGLGEAMAALEPLTGVPEAERRWAWGG